MLKQLIQDGLFGMMLANSWPVLHANPVRVVSWSLSMGPCMGPQVYPFDTLYHPIKGHTRARRTTPKNPCSAWPSRLHLLEK